MKNLIIISLLLIIPCSQKTMAAFSKDSTKTIFGHIGFLTDTKDRIGCQLGFNLSWRKSLLSIKYYHNEEFLVGWPFSSPRINYIQKIDNIALTYGIELGSKHFKVIPTAGLSIGRGNWRNSTIDTFSGSGWFSWPYYEYHYNKFQYVGLLCEINFLWKPIENFGYEINLFANFHSHPDYGIGVNNFFSKSLKSRRIPESRLRPAG